MILSGWINKKRDHGNLLFIDLRDNFGITQCTIDKDNKNFSDLEKIKIGFGRPPIIGIMNDNIIRPNIAK